MSTDAIERLNAALEGRYRIERELGEGGMATVYLADDIKHERKVALKVLKPELAAVVGAERFLAEIKTTANLQHPNILPLHDSGDAAGFLFYVMPFVEGESLRHRLDREKQLPVDEAIQIATEVADALQAAHEEGVIHRDIKPANILLSRGRPLVADFGIALAVSAAGGGRLTETGLSLGTPYYVSPEQASADHEPTAASDVYSLGCVLYEMLVGEPPYIGSSLQSIVIKILTTEPEPVTKLRATVPSNVGAAVATALNKLPADRFSSARGFANALSDRAYSGHLARGSAAETAEMWKRRAIASASVAGVAVLALIWALIGVGSQAADPVRRYGVALPRGEVLQQGFGPRFTLSSDGSTLVYIGPGSGSATQQLWVKHADQLHGTPMPGTDGAIVPTFSPEGDRVAFLDNFAALRIVGLDGAPPIVVSETAFQAGGISWGPDDRIYGVTQSGIARVSVQGGDAEPVTRLDASRQELNHNWPEALPNGRGVLFTVMGSSTTNRAAYDVAVVDLATGEHEALVKGVVGRYAMTGHLLFVRADGALVAAPFDDDALTLTASAVPLIEGFGVKGLGAVDFAVTSTGTLLYSAGGASGGVGAVVWVERDGATRPIDPDWTGEFGHPAISPDGRRLAVGVRTTAGEQISIKDLDAGPLAPLTTTGTQNTRPQWRPGSETVSFLSDQGGGANMYGKRSDGSGTDVMLLPPERSVSEGVWSPNGEWLVYRTSSLAAGRGDVVGFRPDTDTLPTPLVATEFSELNPTVSPDGRWLAYISDESGEYQVYVTPFPNTGTSRTLISTQGGTEPVWAHSGTELFYRSGVGEMVSVTVAASGDDRLTVTDRNGLFDATRFYDDVFHPRYDVSSDDQRFIMIRRGQGVEAVDLVMIENFFEELKRLVPN